MAASDEELHVDESGAECDETAALAELSDEDVVIAGFAELMAISDAELNALARDDEASVLGLESFLAPGGGWEGSEVPARRDPHRHGQ